MLDFVNIALLVIIVLILLGWFVWSRLGHENVIVKVKERTPFAVVNQDENSITLSTKLEFNNESGGSVATIMDAFVRTQLPYEQYDGIEACGKAELEGAPREDDYFEAVLVQAGEKIYINAIVKLTARKGMTLKEAVSHMVDFEVEIIYEECGRSPWHYNKVRMILSAEELARLAGTELVKD